MKPTALTQLIHFIDNWMEPENNPHTMKIKGKAISLLPTEREDIESAWDYSNWCSGNNEHLNINGQTLTFKDYFTQTFTQKTANDEN